MNKHEILIDYEKCTPCKKCVLACYVDVIVWDAAGKKPIAKYPEEEKKPYPKYFYRVPAPPEPEALARMENPMDPSKALPIENINDLLDPGYHEVEAGWCALPQGGLYIANHRAMPGVTVDMINWWFWWHSLEDLRYKIWWPEGHFGISISDRDRATVLDPDTPTTQRFQGRTHCVLGYPNLRSFLPHIYQEEHNKAA